MASDHMASDDVGTSMGNALRRSSSADTKITDSTILIQFQR